jgi:hypothetical protein
MTDDLVAQVASLERRYQALAEVGRLRDPEFERLLADAKRLLAHKAETLEQIKCLQTICAMLKQPRLH